MHSLFDIPALKQLWKTRRWGQPAWQTFERGLFVDLWDSYAAMHDSLPAPVREALAAEVPFEPLTCVQQAQSSDGTLKVLFETADGLKLESVLMAYNSPNKPARYSVCVSSQIGCPARCSFCATATMTYARNLRADEIIAQVVWFNRHLIKQGSRVHNVVFMGMGEPLLNYEAVKQALEGLLTQRYFQMGPRHISVSTVGILPGLEKLLADGLTVNLAVSLHAPNDSVRNQIVPINRAYPIADLMEVLDRWCETYNKDIFYEYVMLRGVNDQPEHARELGELLKNRRCRFNLIPYNPGPGLKELQPTEQEQIYLFADQLREAGLQVLIRHTFGQDIAAACGQLAVQSV